VRGWRLVSRLVAVHHRPGPVPPPRRRTPGACRPGHGRSGSRTVGRARIRARHPHVVLLRLPSPRYSSATRRPDPVTGDRLGLAERLEIHAKVIAAVAASSEPRGPGGQARPKGRTRSRFRLARVPGRGRSVSTRPAPATMARRGGPTSASPPSASIISGDVDRGSGGGRVTRFHSNRKHRVS